MLILNTLLLGLGLAVQLASAHPAKNTDAKLGAVASESAVCSKIGTDILKSGGNAADAFCIGVIGMYHSGLGGGGFATVRSKKGKYEFVDFREMAPAAAFETMYSPPLSNSNYSLYGGLASGVPGEVRGLEYIHKKYGSLPWKNVILPAVKVARYGFPVTEDLVSYMGSSTFMVTDPTWAIDFAPNGTRLGLGDAMTRKRYADALECIANDGPDAYYHGWIAASTIKALQASNGTMTLSDLANYTAQVRSTSNITYRGFKINTGSAPSSGAVVSSVMKIIEGYDMSSPSNLNLSVHYLDEAMRFAYGQRTLLGDPSFLSNITSYQKGMYSEATAAEVRSLIQPDRTLNVTAYNPAGYEILTDDGTSASVASDESGLTIALTSTINTIFGSRVMIPETGIIMNNEMNDFSIPNTTNAFGFIPSEANFIRPFKRPLSSISPTIVERADGSVYISHASAGGSRIITEVIQHLWHTLDQNMTSAQALAEPRMHDQLSPNTVSFEYASELKGIKGYNNQTTAFVASLGSSISFIAPGSTTAQALRVLKNGTFEAAGEPRQLNSAGYAV
ncbi:putative gamma-glutamyltranspeptidase 1 [Cadophora sp. MPI-SDFR-AT-0126]|nr:putative gamma-glutamyltranspeptidase 1 [Leotiomycetes sp. MPI-SDFR-AT-0126]